MRKIRRKGRHSQISKIRIPIALGSIEQNLFSLQGRRRRTSWIRLIGEKCKIVHIDSVDTVIPPLSKVFIGTLKPAGEGVARAPVRFPFQFNAGNRDGAVGLRVWRISLEGVEGYLQVPKPVQTI